MNYGKSVFITADIIVLIIIKIKFIDFLDTILKMAAIFDLFDLGP